MRTIPVDTNALEFRWAGATAHHNYEDGEKVANQTVTTNGERVWKIRCVVVNRAAEEFGDITVVVPHGGEPAGQFESPITFTGLQVKPWAIDGRGSGQSWTAESFTLDAPAPRPSTRTRTMAAATNGAG
ncbi:MAG: hypothetical protein AAF467_27380 [Actinomycetota bacterium]